MPVPLHKQALRLPPDAPAEVEEFVRRAQAKDREDLVIVALRTLTDPAEQRAVLDRVGSTG